MNSLVYLTRACPRQCVYCRLRDSNLNKPELSIENWFRAFDILHELGVEFNLILGNETWLLGKSLGQLISVIKTPYALYTTAPEKLFQNNYKTLFNSGLDNLSSGIDWPYSYLKKVPQDKRTQDQLKSVSAWKAMKFTRKKYPNVDCHGTITVTKLNYKYMFQTVKELSDHGIFIAINFVHWNKDGNFDFFPNKHEISDLLFTEDSERSLLKKEIRKTCSIQGNLIQNLEMFQSDYDHLIDMEWHCEGNPYGGPSVDADGSLRVCGYRKGKYTPELSIFDLPNKFDEWKERVKQDASECPGCGWSYPWQYKFWQYNDVNFRKDVFVRHAGKHIDKSKWAKRKVQ